MLTRPARRKPDDSAMAAKRSALHAQSPLDSAAILSVDPVTGLSASEAARRKRIYGANRLERQKRRSLFSLLGDQVRSVIVWLLAAAAGLSAFVGDLPEAIAILCVLLINTALGFFTSWNAVRSMEALFELTAITARVRRDGRSFMVPVQDLIPGDIVVLEAGDVVPADLRLIEADSLQCDDSALTGESAPVDKTIDALAGDAPLADRTNMGFKGTAVTRGQGLGLVAMTGADTELGRISTLVQTAAPKSYPLEKRLDRLGQTLVLITIALSALIAVAGYLRGLALVDMMETAIALAVAAVPEGLPVVATLALARGLLRMARRNTLIENLSAVETLGATTLVLTDKTGTLTENRMTVTHILLEDRAVDATRIGEDDVGDDPALRRALEIGVLCNSAEQSGRATDGAGVGDPMELALLEVGATVGLTQSALSQGQDEIAKFPFDPDLKMMATMHRDGSGVLVAVKGSPESVLDHASQALTDKGVHPVTPSARKDWVARIDASASQGYRLIGVAFKRVEGAEEPPFDGLTLVGFVALLDPLRADVPAAIAECHTAGVRVVMMTGDHVATASEIAAQAGLGDDGEVVALSETDLRDLASAHPADAGRDLVARADVFARVSPETKLRLVRHYQDAGHIVAMTGDGVNDAPALKQADIGVAMGLRGTQVARDAADVILKDDAFSSIIAAMRQGRIIFGNIRRFVIYLMSCNFSEILVVGLAISAGLPAPLIPLQILFLNIVTDIFPAFALGLNEGDKSVMKRPPRDPAERIVGAAQWVDIVVFGVLITAATLGAFQIALHRFDLPAVDAAAVAFLTLALGQLWHVFNMRTRDEGPLVNSVTRNPFVYAALVFCLGLLALAFYVPAAAQVLQLGHMNQSQLALAMGASLVPLVLGQIWLVASRGMGAIGTGKGRVA
ncbi:cation-translocating P-type ATPase [Arenibacterium sp. CAU 1754]